MGRSIADQVEQGRLRVTPVGENGLPPTFKRVRM